MNSNGNSNGIQMILKSPQLRPSGKKSRANSKWKPICGLRRSRAATEIKNAHRAGISSDKKLKTTYCTRPNGMKVSSWSSCVLANVVDQSINNGRGMNKKSAKYLLTVE